MSMDWPHRGQWGRKRQERRNEAVRSLGLMALGNRRPFDEGIPAFPEPPLSSYKIEMLLIH